MEFHAPEIATLGSVVLLLVTALRKLAIAEFRAPKLTLAVFLCGVLLGILTISLGLRAMGYRPDTTVARLAHQNFVKAERAIQDSVENLLIIDGGSHAARGIDPGLLEARLAEQGFTVSVISFAAPGANHLERFSLLIKFADKTNLSALHAREEINIILLRESNRSYDASPLAQFRENLFTNRSIGYLDIRNAFRAIQALLSAPKTEPNSQRGSTAYRLAQHSLIDLFNISAMNRMVRSDSFELVAHHSRTNQREGFTFPGVGAVLKKDSPTKSERWISYRNWKKHLIDEPLNKIFRPDRLIFFAVPTLRKGTWQYLESYAEDHPSAALLSFRDEDRLLRDLNTPDVWYDTGHLSASGAKIYTEWLAEKMSRPGLLANRR